MSSVAVRTAIKTFIGNNTAEKVFDMTAMFGELNKNLIANTPSISPSDKWVGLQFIGGDERPITVPATNNQGTYREDGAIYIHAVAPAGFGAVGDLLTRADTLRSMFRGQRIGSILIQSVTPINTEDGATLQFEGGWTSASFLCDYIYDRHLTP